MITSLKTSRSLITQIQYLTSKSRKQTTPRYIRNPLLVKHPLTDKPKPQHQPVPADTPNAHLYWNMTEFNKLNRQAYSLRRHKKLEITPIYKNGQKVVERQLSEILKELADRKVLHDSPARTFTNFVEIFKRFPESVEEHRELYLFALRHLEAQINSLNFQQFSMLCYVNNILKIPPTEKLAMNLYYHLYTFFINHIGDQPSKLHLQRLSNTCRYIFSVEQSAAVKDLFYKKKRPLKLFEDHDPESRSIEEIMNTLLSKETVEQYVASVGKEAAKKVAAGFKNVPGEVYNTFSALV